MSEEESKKQERYWRLYSMANAIKISLADGDFDWYDVKNFVVLKKLSTVENIDEVL